MRIGFLLVWVRRPESDARYLPQLLSLLLFETEFFIETRAPRFSYTGWPTSSGESSFSTSSALGLEACVTPGVFIWVMGN